MTKHHSSHPSDHLNELTLDRVLFEGHVPSVVAVIHENEKPPLGLVGLIDWYTRGLISGYLRSGILTGKSGECSYIPFQNRGRTFHILLLGAGKNDHPGLRTAIDTKELETLHQNLLALKLPKVGISKSDLGNVDESTLTKRFKGVNLWIGP